MEKIFKRDLRSKKNYHNNAGFLRYSVLFICVAALFMLYTQRVDISGFLLQETLAGVSIYKTELDSSAQKSFEENSSSGENNFTEKINPTEENTSGKSEMYYLEYDSELQSIEEVAGRDDIFFQPDTEWSQTPVDLPSNTLDIDIDRLHDLNYLKTNFYNMDTRTTDMSVEDFDVEKFMQTDLKISTSGDDPKILIFHTHSCEMYADSDIENPMEGIMGVGERLAQILNDVYGIKTIHHTGRYDFINGNEMRNGAYERMEPEIKNVLNANPSIEVALDLHRDGLLDNTRLITTQNGVVAAQIMFLNGLTKIKSGGEIKKLTDLPNPYLTENLALSFQAQLIAKTSFPNLARKVYLKPYRYSLNMLPKSMLIEVGAQTNTKQEALNSMEPLAAILAEIFI